MIRLIRLAVGWVEFEIEGDCSLFLDRAKKGIWRVRKHKGKLHANCAMYNYKNLAKIAKKSGCRLKIVKKRGFPKLLRKVRFRYGILSGLLVIITVFFVTNLFVWDVNVNGNTIIPTKDILNEASNNGLHIGSLKGLLKLDDIKYELQDKFPQIAWISINRIGNKYNIELSEIEPKPNEIDKKTPCNVVANYDGVILSIEPYDGFEMVKAGDVVRKDDLLVSGIKENEESGQVLFAHASAKVIAQVDREMQFTKPIKQEDEKKEDNKTIKKRRIKLFGLNFPLYLKTPSQDEYNLDIKEENLKLFNITFPIKIEVMNYNKKEQDIVDEDNISILKRELMLKAKEWERDNLNLAKIINRQYEYKNDGVRLKLFIKDTVEQRIDIEKPIIIEQSENDNNN